MHQHIQGVQHYFGFQLCVHTEPPPVECELTVKSACWQELLGVILDILDILDSLDILDIVNINALAPLATTTRLTQANCNRCLQARSTIEAVSLKRTSFVSSLVYSLSLTPLYALAMVSRNAGSRLPSLCMLSMSSSPSSMLFTCMLQKSNE